MEPRRGDLRVEMQIFCDDLALGVVEYEYHLYSLKWKRGRQAVFAGRLALQRDVFCTVQANGSITRR